MNISRATNMLDELVEQAGCTPECRALRGEFIGCQTRAACSTDVVDVVFIASEKRVHGVHVPIPDCWMFGQQGARKRFGIIRFINHVHPAVFTKLDSDYGVGLMEHISVCYSSKSFNLVVGESLVNSRVAVAKEQAKLKTYIIEAPRAEAVKIGISSDPEGRLRNCQTGSPEELKLVGTLNGNHERDLHNKFADYRRNGEWFAATPVLTWWEAEGKFGFGAHDIDTP